MNGGDHPVARTTQATGRHGHTHDASSGTLTHDPSVRTVKTHAPDGAATVIDEFYNPYFETSTHSNNCNTTSKSNELLNITVNYFYLRLFQMHDYFRYMTPNVVVEWLKLLLRIREVRGSNLGPKTVYPD
jgi:hypothetical protein